MGDTKAERAFIETLYSGDKWKQRVKRMSDAQVIAIYLRDKGKALKNEPKPESDEDDDLTLF